MKRRSYTATIPAECRNIAERLIHNQGSADDVARLALIVLVAFDVANEEYDPAEFIGIEQDMMEGRR